MKLEKKRILITQNSLNNLAGSEITTLELASYLVSQGALVTIYTYSYGFPISDEFSKIKGLKIISDINQAEAVVSFSDFDFIWVHHQVLPVSLLQELKDGATLPPINFHHMSAHASLENPYINRLESYIGSKSTFNSLETKEKSEKYYDNIHSHSYAIYQNPVPLSFSNETPRQRVEQKKILVVSNHVPSEVSEAAELLRENNIEVEFIGKPHNPVRVTAKLINKYDTVISIGKTVQYSLVLGVPVYCYDHFGGPGYLVKDNYIMAENHNFSGRGFDITKTAKDIADELVSGYENAEKFSRLNRLSAIDQYGIANNVQRVLGDIQSRGDVKVPHVELESFMSLQHVVSDFVNMHVLQCHESMRFERELIAASHNLIKSSHKADQLHQKNLSLDQELKFIKMSRSYRSVQSIRKLFGLNK